MKLCVDVGNTTINIGFYQDDKLINQYIFASGNKKAPYFYALFKDTFKEKEVEDIIFSSVVPSIDNALLKALKKLYNAPIYFVNVKDIDLKMNIDNKEEVGSDLICDLVGAKAKYTLPLLVVDLGTATKYLYLDKEGIFQSALIVPGLKLSIKALFSSTDLLPEVDLSKPTSIMDSKNTIKCIKNGILFSHVSAIEGISKQYQKENKDKLSIIITGGDMDLVRPLLDENKYIFDDHLILDGEVIIFNKMKERRS